ncbi:hypothetical protein S40285_10485 [Stachybotrys chlorohalonatus IBT 40285]|uniref:Uncharacterized protein n=1 Tax=Stachybotrys chlorohalonatus (strain IBT 40285) TaxID=1283841 RepID=A0A084QAW1_STAC4|nr:hypothetical protein S40285_10485 [Stachybotrys chlorohalonata IBT 40285]
MFTGFASWDASSTSTYRDGGPVSSQRTGDDRPVQREQQHKMWTCLVLLGTTRKERILGQILVAARETAEVVVVCEWWAVLRTGKHARTTAGEDELEEGKGQELQERTRFNDDQWRPYIDAELPNLAYVRRRRLRGAGVQNDADTKTNLYKTAGFGNVRCCPAERERMEKREGRVEREAAEAGPQSTPRILRYLRPGTAATFSLGTSVLTAPEMGAAATVRQQPSYVDFPARIPLDPRWSAREVLSPSVRPGILDLKHPATKDPTDPELTLDYNVMKAAIPFRFRRRAHSHHIPCRWGSDLTPSIKREGCDDTRGDVPSLDEAGVVQARRGIWSDRAEQKKSNLQDAPCLPSAAHAPTANPPMPHAASIPPCPSPDETPFAKLSAQI